MKLLRELRTRRCTSTEPSWPTHSEAGLRFSATDPWLIDRPNSAQGAGGVEPRPARFSFEQIDWSAALLYGPKPTWVSPVEVSAAGLPPEHGCAARSQLQVATLSGLDEPSRPRCAEGAPHLRQLCATTRGPLRGPLACSPSLSRPRNSVRCVGLARNVISERNLKRFPPNTAVGIQSNKRLARHAGWTASSIRVMCQPQSVNRRFASGLEDHRYAERRLAALAELRDASGHAAL